jgi:hypothetical protein
MYTVAEASNISGYSIRTIQRNCIKHKVPKVEGNYTISKVMLDAWQTSANKPTTKPKTNDSDKNDTTTTANNSVTYYHILAICFVSLILLFGFIFKSIIEDKNNQINRTNNNYDRQINKLQSKIDTLTLQNQKTLQQNSILKDSINKMHVNQMNYTYKKVKN